jgi:MFS family permease
MACAPLREIRVATSNPVTSEAPAPKRLPFFYGWVVVAVAFVTMAIGVNIRTGFSLLFPPILDEFGWNRAETAATFSLGFFVSAAVSPWLGVAMDRFGPRRVVPASAILVAAGLALATLSTRPWHLYLTLGVLVVGSTVIFTYTGHSMFLPNWFRRRRGLAIGIAFSGVGVGSIVLFPWMQAIIAGSGWRDACWMLAALLLVLVLPLNYAFQRSRPEDMGLHPDGDAEATQAAAPGAGKAAQWNTADGNWTLKGALTSAPFWWIGMGYFCGLFVWYAVQVHQTKYLMEIGIKPDVAAYALGFVGLGGIIGQIGLGYLSDRIGREWAYTIAALGFVASYGCLLIMAHDPSTLWVWLMVGTQGAVGYGLASVYGPIPAEIFHGRHFGTIFGVISLMSTMGAGIGPWVAGFAKDWTGSYSAAWWICIALSFISIGCIWMSAWTRPSRQA